MTKNPNPTSGPSEFSKGHAERSNELSLRARVRSLMPLLRDLVVSSRLAMESDLESAVVARQAGFVRLRSCVGEFCRWPCCRCCLAVLSQRGEKDDRQLVPAPCLAGPSGRPG